MKRILTLFCLSISLFINAQDFDITNFDVDLEINADGSFNVTETLDVYFRKEKRGIYREIENIYKINNGTVQIGISNIAVNGHDYNVNNKKDKVIIRIGNPDIYLSGTQQYIISYVIKNGIITYPEHQEFHYDVTGNSWNAPIDKVDFTIKLPKRITLTADDIKVTGGRENQALNIAELRQIDSRTLKGKSLRRLNKNNGITAAIRLPKNYLEVANNEVTYLKQEEKKIYQPWYIALPLALFGLFLSFWRKMRTTGFVSDEEEINLYPPKGLTSAHVGAFVDQTSNTRDIVSLLPYWASEGYIEMKQIGEEIYLYKMNNLPPDFPEYEHIIFNRLFEESEVAKISDLKTKFHSTLSIAQSLLTSEVKLQDYYDPEYIKTFRSWKLVLFPLFMIGLGLVSLIYFKLIFLGIGFFAVALGGFILPLFNLPLTEKGARLKSEIDGFRRFLKDPDEKVLEKVIKEDPSYFDKMFPFAIAFGLEKNFLNKLEPYMTNVPYWYHSDHKNQSFSTFSSGFKPEVIQSAFSSTPHNPSSGGASGGGFSSGSGVGGGGGGSW